MNSVNATKTQELSVALDAVERALNVMGGSKEKEVAVRIFFSRMHRTLQQQFVLTVILPILRFLDEAYVNDWTDARNEAAARMAHKMLAALDDADTYLPLI